ncbi:MAG: ATP-binding protein [Spirochaetales bacterium]|nr:ATP-binding protein [Spirochaetales bacterium]
MKTLRYRGFFFLNVIIISLASLLIAGSMIFLIRNGTITKSTIQSAEVNIAKLARETESNLGVIENSILLLNRTAEVLDLEQFSEIMDETIWDQELIRAIYVLDNRGMSLAVGTRENRTALHSDYVGIDFSQTPLFKSIEHRKGFVVWSDIFVSVLSGDTSVGLGIMMDEYTLIAELSLQALLDALILINDGEGRLWVIDGRGELIADTDNDNEAGILNVRSVPFMTAAVKGESLDSVVRFDNRPYHVTSAASDKLGWLFLWGTPSGIYNSRIRTTIYEILLIAFSFLALTFVISPFWIRRISSDVMALKAQAESIAENRELADVIKTNIFEFQELSSYMYEMHGEIRVREDELIELNKALEARVEERTLELEIRYEELYNSLEDLQNMQENLVESEKLAALGRLVAGVAHELNTPIGNSVMALSSLKDEFSQLHKLMEKGIKKTEFERFLEFSEKGVDISYRNVQRAAELVTSFKHVANDQTSSIRREFDLQDIVHDVLLTLHPMIKKTRHQVKMEVGDNIILNSYPGVVGQILTNLINNAFYHAFEGIEEGILVIGSREVEPLGKEQEGRWMEIFVRDDGVGINADSGKKIFDPFYTSKAGLGGTGLGLNIALNGARKILGGELDYVSRPGEGTTFRLTVPLVAPDYTKV